MPVLPIVVTADHNDVLTTKATRVPRVDDGIRRLMDDMVETMFSANGVGLAAPQVNVPLRVIAFNHDTSTVEIERTYGRYLNNASDDLTRKALLADEAATMLDNVVKLAR